MRVGYVLVLLGLSLFGIFAGTAWAAQQPEIGDEHVIYCLSEGNRAALAAAGVALHPSLRSSDDLIGSGSSMKTLEQWRAADAKAFARTCAALTAAVPSLKRNDLPNPLWALLSVLLPVLTGGVLTLVSSEWRHSMNLGAKYADDLSDAAEDFVLAARVYAQARTDHELPSATAFDTAHAALSRQLYRAGRARPAWPAIRRASRILERSLSRGEVDRGIEHVRPELEALAETLALTDAAFRRPWAPFRRMP
ncbi:hypothetical protein [Nonomuraea sp. NPDC050540]|uniref:hypothetical protein n=1 Tax=Nonomuraea sp. NPDC050540 TaxID=3364367 RepID=UPI0037B09537